MKAKKSLRIYMENRTKLEEVIPLTQPFVIFVDPASICNFQCQFCANGNKELIKKTGRKQGVMDMNIYMKLIDEIALLPIKTKVLRLYKEGEPLMNGNLPAMIQYAKKSGAFESIDLTTNGSLLTKEKSVALIDAGLDRINISVEALSTEKYKSITTVDLNFEEYVKNIKYFYDNRKECTVFIKTIGNYLEKDEREFFYNTFGDISDLIAIENLAPCWPEYDMRDFEKDFDCGIYGQEKGVVEVCPYLFYTITVNVDGSVSACYLDWEHKLIVGDLHDDSFMDIWNGEKMQELRKLHLQKRRCDNEVCRNCGQLTYGAPDNIDQFAEELLKRF
jgi:radical SAM protein with 4Fe4S-binding SPASM domain